MVTCGGALSVLYTEDNPTSPYYQYDIHMEPCINETNGRLLYYRLMMVSHTTPPYLTVNPYTGVVETWPLPFSRFSAENPCVAAIQWEYLGEPAPGMFMFVKQFDELGNTDCGGGGGGGVSNDVLIAVALIGAAALVGGVFLVMGKKVV